MNSLKVEQYIENWLREKHSDTHTDAFVVGVSGGIDSALVSTLCAETGIKTIVVSLPIGSQPLNSNEHINMLTDTYDNVEYREINLTDQFEFFYGDTFEFSELALVNIASRLRMTALYGIANTENALVVGTGNKVEDYGIGFFTKYGDGGVDISPIADLLKSEVYEMSRDMGISDDIIAAAPTDGLWDDGRTDEDAIGYSYDELEWAMKITDDYAAASSSNATAFSSFDTYEVDLLNEYNKRHTQTRHKLEVVPICELTNEMKYGRSKL